MKTKVFGLMIAAALVVLLVGCGGVSREEFKKELDKLNEGNAPTFAPIWKETMLAIYDGNYEEIEKMEYISDKAKLVSELSRTKTLSKTIASKMEKFVDSDKLNKEQKRDVERSIAIFKDLTKMIENAGDDPDKLLKTYYQSVRNDIVSAYYDCMKKGQFEFVSEEMKGDKGWCYCNIGEIKYTYHFKKIDGKWKYDTIKSLDAANDLLEKLISQIS